MKNIITATPFGTGLAHLCMTLVTLAIVILFVWVVVYLVKAFVAWIKRRRAAKRAAAATPAATTPAATTPAATPAATKTSVTVVDQKQEYQKLLEKLAVVDRRLLGSEWILEQAKEAAEKANEALSTAKVVRNTAAKPTKDMSDAITVAEANLKAANDQVETCKKAVEKLQEDKLELLKQIRAAEEALGI